jgi:pyruvate formate lyase activating enzyme
MEFNMLGINEVRIAYFLKAFHKKEEEMLILSFGKCNYNCSYCKRDGQFKDEHNNIINSKIYSWDEIKNAIDKAMERGYRIRLSGGEPSLFQEESLHIAQYLKETYNQKLSLAHNGSSPAFISSMAPYLEYVAIDMKGCNDDQINKRTGNVGVGKLEKTLSCIEIAKSHGILIDLRTCIFKDTSFSELVKIAAMLPEDQLFWTLRKYNKVDHCSFEEPSLEYIDECSQRLKKITNIPIGYRAKWENCNFVIV